MNVFRKTALWILVGLFSLGQFQRVELSVSQSAIAFYWHDIFIIFFIFHTFFTQPIAFYQYIYDFFKKNKKIHIFSIIVLISLTINTLYYFDSISLLYVLRLIAYLLFGFSLTYLVKTKKIESEYLRFQIFSIGLIALFLGFLQFIFIKDTRFLSILGWDDHYARLISTYFDPGFTGIIFVITGLLGLSSKYVHTMLPKIVITLFFSWGIILTFSRASYLSLGIAICIVFFSHVLIKEKISTRQIVSKLFFSVLLFLLLVIAAPKPYGEGVNLLRTSTISARSQAVWQQLETLTPQTLLIGNGLFSEKNSLNSTANTYAELKPQSTTIIPSHSRIPDNIFITVLLSTGVFGLVLFTLVLIDLGKQLMKKNIYIFAGYVALFIHSQFNNSLLQPFVLLIFLSGLASFQKK